MKLYKLKDTIAVVWFFILVLLQYNRYYKTVLGILVLGGIGDLLVSVTNIGELDIDLKNLFFIKLKYFNT